MPQPSVLDVLRIPPHMLAALDWRPYHFALQPYHYVVRLAHVISMAAFYGGIVLLDLRLMGWRRKVSLRHFADQTLPWLYAAFGITIASGLALFFYDPVHVGSHAYFTLKLLLTLLGLVNAAAFRRAGYLAALASEETAASLSEHARSVGAISLLLWTGVLICACLNVEGPPNVLLR